MNPVAAESGRIALAKCIDAVSCLAMDTRARVIASLVVFFGDEATLAREIEKSVELIDKVATTQRRAKAAR